MLIIVLGCTSYFTGLLWFIFCDMRAIQNDEVADYAEQEEGLQNFNNYFELYDKDNSQKLITLAYFAFTSLSTVGFGDYHPRGNSERVVGAFFMLFGVAITSFCMESISQMIVKFKQLFL